MIKAVTVQNLPKTIKTVITPMNKAALDKLELYECTAKQDFYDIQDRVPFEIMPIAKRSGTGKTIEGYFWVGIFVPVQMLDDGGTVVVYYYMTDADYRQHQAEMRAYLDQKARKWADQRSAWRRVMESRT